MLWWEGSKGEGRLEKKGRRLTFAFLTTWVNVTYKPDLGLIMAAFVWEREYLD